MQLIKSIFLLGWAIFLTGVIIIIARQLAFRNRKDLDMNLSEAIHISSLLIGSIVIFKIVLELIAGSYLRLESPSGMKTWWPLLKISSSLAVAGLVSLVAIFFISRFLSILVFGPRKDFIQFRSDNRVFACIRFVILITVSFLAQPILTELYSHLLPDIKVPMFR